MDTSSSSSATTFPPGRTLLPSDADRLIADLEFLQLLASPDYLHHLAISGYFEDSKFLNYLQYLQYWKQPKYAKYVLFPASLGILDALVSSKQLRDDLKFLQVIEVLRQQLLCHWMSGPLYDKRSISEEAASKGANMAENF